MTTVAAAAHDTVTREGERERILSSFEVFEVPPHMQAEILEALDSGEWDWFRDCDGCTGVSELHWPTRYFPPCLRHDFDWKRGQGDWAGSRRFYGLQLAYGVPMWRASIRAFAVTIKWYCWEKWCSVLAYARGLLRGRRRGA